MIELTKEELEHEFNYGITVEELIMRLKRMPQDLIVINACKNAYPIADVRETDIDYCYDDKIQTRHVVSIW